MIAIGGYYDEKADLATEVGELRELGLAGLKLKVGGLEPEQDAARARLVRDAGGDDFILAADANQGWTPEQAIRFARLAEDCDLVWLEGRAGGRTTGARCGMSASRPARRSAPDRASTRPQDAAT
jgi:L-alanine-DL-glutamate epimerase-like enolase superfamily enzyme